MSLVVGGRIFYEIDLVDTMDDSILFMHFHSALDLVKDFEISEGRNGRLVAIILILIGIALLISVIIFYLYIRKGKKTSQEPVEIEFNQLKN